MNKPIIREEFKPDFNRIKQYDRLYFNTPVDILEDERFLDLPTATQAVYQHMCRLSFRRANTNGWFLVTSKDNDSIINDFVQHIIFLYQNLDKLSEMKSKLYNK